jgi:hypothetical protein
MLCGFRHKHKNINDRTSIQRWRSKRVQTVNWALQKSLRSVMPSPEVQILIVTTKWPSPAPELTLN